MKIEQIEWPCGCKAVPGAPIGGVFMAWVLHHCPLHGAAGELRDTVARFVDWCDKCGGVDGSIPFTRALVSELRAALASAEPKPKATEGVVNGPT